MASDFQQEPEFSLDWRGLIPSQQGRIIRWGAIVVGLILLFVLLSLSRSIYTNLLWYGQVGFESVYVKVLLTRVWLFIAGAFAFAVPAGVSLFYANRLSQGPEELPLPQVTRDLLRRLIFWGAVAAVAVLSLIFGATAATEWEVVLRFGSAVPFAIPDPVYGKDLSFYVFSLPLYEFIQGWLLGAAIVIGVATLGMYFVNFSFRGVGFLITPGLKVQVSIIVAFVLFTLAFGHWLDRWGLLLSERGAVFGAAYTDLHALKPALLVLTIIAIAGGVLVLINAYMRGVRLLVGGAVLWGVSAVILGAGWPNAMQRLTVNPNEFAKERL